MRVIGNYLPRERVAFNNEIVNPFTGEVTRPPTMTKQEMRDQCDINNIVKMYKRTGMISHISARAAMGTYQDLPDPMDLQESLAVVQRAKEAFESLPSRIREKVGNSPTAFMEYLRDPKNADELVELGLVTRPQAQTPTAPSSAPSPTSPAPGAPSPAPTA